MGKPSRKRTNPVVASRRQLVPHTPAWFRELRRIDPMKAAITNAILERTGQMDGRSICGDRPAPIHDMLGDPWFPLRLCADCADIRDGLGEQMVRRDMTAREDQ